MSKTAHFNKTVVQVMIGSNSHVLAEMKSGKFNDIVWASDSLETVAHYYEGCVISLTVILDKAVAMNYVALRKDLEVPTEDYTWGFADVAYPSNSRWYSFSKTYLAKHLVGVKEIHPDLSAYFEEE